MVNRACLRRARDTPPGAPISPHPSTDPCADLSPWIRWITGVPTGWHFREPFHALGGRGKGASRTGMRLDSAGAQALFLQVLRVIVLGEVERTARLEGRGDAP